MKATLTSTKFDGNIVMVFNRFSRLVYFSIRAMLTDEQHEFFVENAPVTISNLNRFKTSQNVTIKYEDLDISFDGFYDTYDHRTRSSRIRSEKAWNKLSVADKVEAIEYIPIYNDLCAKDGTARKYAENYIQDKVWIK